MFVESMNQCTEQRVAPEIGWQIPGHAGCWQGFPDIKLKYGSLQTRKHQSCLQQETVCPGTVSYFTGSKEWPSCFITPGRTMAPVCLIPAHCGSLDCTALTCDSCECHSTPKGLQP